jgi:flagellin-like protein
MTMVVRRWRFRNGKRGIAPIIGQILLLAMTIIVMVLVFSFHFTTPPPVPSVTFLIHSGGSNPVWGDPTDTPAHCANPSGCYSLMNTSQIIVASSAPTNIPLSLVEFTFVCDNTSVGGNVSILVQGTLAAMTWFPGTTGNPPSDAPTLGWCASFHAGGYGGGSFGTLYNRLGLFVPIAAGYTVLQAGDTFILYIHNGGYPLDYDGGPDCAGSSHTAPCFDGDDYHGAPPWCFTNPGACTIYLSYLGTPSTLLAKIPVYSLAPPQA